MLLDVMNEPPDAGFVALVALVALVAKLTDWLPMLLLVIKEPPD